MQPPQILANQIKACYSCMHSSLLMIHSNQKHIIDGENGKAKEEMITIIDKLVSEVEKQNFKVRYVCSDSEPKTNQLHQAFQEYLKEFKGETFDKLLAYVDAYPHLIPVSDWLHILKNLRSRLLKH